MRAMIVSLEPTHPAALAVVERELAKGERLVALGVPTHPLDGALALAERHEPAGCEAIASVHGRRVFVAPRDFEPRELRPGDLVFVPGSRPSRERRGEVEVVCPGAIGGEPGDPRVCFARIGATEDGLTIELARVCPPLAPLAESAPMSGRRWLDSPRHAPPLDPGMRGPDAALALLAPRLGPVYHAGSGPWPEDAVEHVHDVRVATRRLRAALAVLGPLLPAKPLARALERLEDFGRALGGRRAADVNLERVAELRAELESDEECAVADRLGQLSERRRRRTGAALFEGYPPERVARHGLRLLELACSAPPDGPALCVGLEAELSRRARAVAGRLGTMAHPSDDEGHHRLRIALKRLRYTVEIASEVMESRVPKSASQDLKRLQEALGLLHDEVELLGLVEGPRVRRGAPARAIDAVAARLRARRGALFEEAQREVSARGARLLSALAG